MSEVEIDIDDLVDRVLSRRGGVEPYASDLEAYTLAGAVLVLRSAMRKIVAMNTPSSNATVRRMVAIASKEVGAAGPRPLARGIFGGLTPVGNRKEIT
jgi:hypothetical protein